MKTPTTKEELRQTLKEWYALGTKTRFQVSLYPQVDSETYINNDSFICEKMVDTIENNERESTLNNGCYVLHFIGNILICERVKGLGSDKLQHISIYSREK